MEFKQIENKVGVDVLLAEGDEVSSCYLVKEEVNNPLNCECKMIYVASMERNIQVNHGKPPIQMYSSVW